MSETSERPALSAGPRHDRSLINVGLLALCQALAMSGQNMILLSTGVVGYSLADEKALATLPLALQFVATMLATFPMSFLMRARGRRFGFILGACFGIVGAGLATLAVFERSFPLLCAGTMCVGVFAAGAQFYRFAAVDTASEAFKPKAISYVLAGGVVAAFLGPLMFNATREIFTPVIYAGTYASLVSLYVVSIGILSWLDIPPPPKEVQVSAGRSMREIARQPSFAVAVISAVIAYCTMSLLMTATPLSMTIFCGYTDAESSFVVQWHVVGMFAPSFFTGWLIQRFGLINVMTVGGVLLGIAAAINLSGITIPHFWSALFLLGVGWNFLFIGATTLLTETYRPEEKAKIQALNDFLVFGSVGTASFMAGVLFHSIGWANMNLVALPLVVVALAALTWLRRIRPSRGLDVV